MNCKSAIAYARIGVYTKKTWRSADRSTVIQIDHICTSRRWISASQDVRMYRGSDLATDHYVFVLKQKMKLKCRRKTDLFHRHNKTESTKCQDSFRARRVK